MNSTRDKIVKTWSGISEVALIKEVATKGEHIQLCIEYLARKRKLPLAEYELFFQDVVQTYVQRLLSERLVHKAENVLCNVKRDVKSFYFQFACECDDEELRELLLDYLSKKDPHHFAQDVQELQFNWELLQQVQLCPNVRAKCKEKMRRVNLETLMGMDVAFQKRLIVELYFEGQNEALLQHLDKLILWDFIVETENITEIIRWCNCASAALRDSHTNDYTELELQYSQWTLEPDMFEFAMKALKDPNEMLRNCFASFGHFFAEERDEISTVLRRICSTESFERNAELLEKLPLGHFLLTRGQFTLMLSDFVNEREVEEMADEFQEQQALLNLIVALKGNNLQERSELEKVFYATKIYLESRGVNFQSEQPLVTFFDFMCNEPTVASLNCFLLSSVINKVPLYLKSLATRLETNNGANSMPTPYDFLRKFKTIDFKEVCKDMQEVASFSNERLCQKYARKYHLNFVHYLKQQRSCYAVYYMLLIEHMQHYGHIKRSSLFSACEVVTELALQHADHTDLITHCVAFIEMLNFDSQHLRNFLKLNRMLEGSNVVPNYGLLIAQVERELIQRLNQQPDTFPLADYQALMRIVACNQYRQWPALIMQRYARDDDWWRLLVLLQFFEVPLQQIKQISGHFGSRITGEHLLRALLHDRPATERTAKRHTSFSRQHKKSRKTDNSLTTTSVETITSSISSCNDAGALLKASSNQLHFLPDTYGSFDLFALILLSTSNVAEEEISSAAHFLELMQDNRTYSTSLNLMKNCVKFRQPVLALLAATLNNDNVDWNWIVWLSVATEQWDELLQTMRKEVNELPWRLIENSVRQKYTGTLQRCFSIFYEGNAFEHFLNFLHRTQYNSNIGDEAVDELRLFLLAWSNDEVQLPFAATSKREEIMLRCIKLLLAHLQQGFQSTADQQKFLSCLCKSDLSDISGLLDFCRLNEVFTTLQNVAGWTQRFRIDFEQLLEHSNRQYEQLLGALIEAKHYDAAIRLASLLQLPISDIVYSKWVAYLDESCLLHDQETFQRCEDEIVEHSLPPEILVNFFLYAASRLEDGATRKYLLLKRALNVIKKNHLFPNESFDRDQIEYEMIMCYLHIENDEAQTLEVYHSEYYEEIMLKERCVLYKSFLELKELAGIDDLAANTKAILTEDMQLRLEALLNKLLDQGDIVEALRLQELFEFRPIDLRFVVFCMALAEGVTTIFSMSLEERQLLRDIEKSSFVKFNKRTLGWLHSSGSHQGYISPLKTSSDLSDSCSTLEFEEIPSKEKRETLDTIQGIASKLKNGVDIGKRIVMAYRAAMYLDKEYLDVLRTKDTAVLLQSVAEEGCLHRLLVVSDILNSTHMTSTEIAELLAFEITTAIVRPRFYLFSGDQQATNNFKNADLWGYNIDCDLHLFLELTPNTTKLGNMLLEYCDALRVYRKYQDNKPHEGNATFEKLKEIITRYGLPAAESSTARPPQVLSHKKQNLICVELLIKAHQCFVHECSMEGIANVLNRTKTLNAVLTKAKSWSLLVRMLTGIARYREMFYCFDALIENEQFESLLGQFDEEKTTGLRQAILTYLREYCPQNGREYLKLAALHFLMYKDLAEMWEQDAQVVLSKVLVMGQINSAQLPEQNSMVALLTTANALKTHIPRLRSSTELIALLHQSLENYTHTTENYLLDNKLLLAQKSASMAEMVAMQIDLASKALSTGAQLATCVCVINVQTRYVFRELINSQLSVPQSLILSRAYGYDINWTEVLLSQFVVLQRGTYLNEYLAHFPISDSLISNIVKGFQAYAQHHKPTRQMEEHLGCLVELVRSITLKYKLASMLSLKSIVVALINEQTSFYLRDTHYGRAEDNNMPDI